VQSEEEEEKEEYMLAILPQHSKLNVPLLSKSTMKHIRTPNSQDLQKIAGLLYKKQNVHNS
jgi:hypothetical protein